MEQWKCSMEIMGKVISKKYCKVIAVTHEI